MNITPVMLVGAGPGDVDLLTIRALRCIEQAQVIVYDRLVGKEILKLAGRECRMIYAGKRKHLHAMSQAQINAALVEHVSAGLRVVRLKGGDPMLFGRVAEEQAALQAAGLGWELVPGVTAASGAAASAGLPLTQRGYAQAVTYVTAHRQSGELDVDWTLLARHQQTVVVYMGLSVVAELAEQMIARGKPVDTSVTVVFNATHSDEYIWQTRLDAVSPLPTDAPKGAPAVLIIHPTEIRQSQPHALDLARASVSAG